MICPKCKGERAVYRKVGNIITLVPCPICNGTGEFNPNDTERFNGVDLIKLVEMIKGPKTNFDRITASPETLARFIHKAEDVYERCCKGDLRCDLCECQWCGLASRKTLIEWLNEGSKE